jgi:2-succinyl-6-hydroxy-2,4-cyclohexadiene-1-carboxylate synthase
MLAGAIDWNVVDHGSGTPLLLVHGFTGSVAAWDGQAATFGGLRVIAVDLPGHGRTHLADPELATVERTAADLAVLLHDLDAAPADVLGYSLGARIALRLAVAHPEAVSRLVLESPSAGMADPAERAARRMADELLAQRIEAEGIAAFVDEWERNPVFASHAALPPERARHLRAMRLASDPAGLAASLRGAGQGRMEPLHGRLAEVVAPTLVITGALDAIGRPRAEEVAAGIATARLAVIDGAGHTPHEEQPEAFARLVPAFLQEDPAA